MAARRGYAYWRAHGRPWRLALPINHLVQRLRGYGYEVGTLGNDAHLTHNPPEDHTPYSATGWPIGAAFGIVWACDIMAPKAGSGLPSLAELGAQLYADRMAADPGAGWIKYMNWTGADKRCVHDSWKPQHQREPSGDKGHIHISGRTDCGTYALAAGYDPIARIREKKNAAKPAPAKPQPARPAPDLTRRLLMELPTLKQGSTGTPVRRLQALINVAGGKLTVDGAFGPGTAQGLRTAQARAKVPATGVADERTWAALLGVPL